jgi:hypothetical protein
MIFIFTSIRNKKYINKHKICFKNTVKHYISNKPEYTTFQLSADM